MILTETIRVSNIIEAEQHPEGMALKDINDLLPKSKNNSRLKLSALLLFMIA